MNCRICGGICDLRFTRPVLGKYDCRYFYCDACGFLQTEEPYWIEEAYDSAITIADTGLVWRNISLSKRVSTLLFFIDRGRGKYLDAAGGYGIFTRLMRDIGFDFYWSDKYCENLVARGFEVTETTPPFEAVTAFEVMEHVPDPLDFLQNTLAAAQSRTIIFSTELFKQAPPQPDEWWYYTFKTGQHVSFYQERTLQELGRRLGLRCYSNNHLHILTDKALSETAFRLLTEERLTRLLSIIPEYALNSRTMTDHSMWMAKL